MSEKLEFTLNNHRHTLVIRLEYEQAPDFISYSPATLSDVRDTLKALPSDRLLEFLHHVLEDAPKEVREDLLAAIDEHNDKHIASHLIGLDEDVDPTPLDAVKRIIKERDDALVAVDVLKGQLAELEKGTTP